MDEDLKEYLDARFAESEARTLHLLTDLKESLGREIKGLGQRMDAFFDALTIRLDNQTTRLDRQGALLQIGSRWTNRANEWAEKIDAALETKDREINELRARVEKLEGGAGSGSLPAS